MQIKINDSFKISIHKDGVGIVGLLLMLMSLSLAVSGLNSITTILLFLFLFGSFFFRDPDRVINNQKGAIISPADGIVIGVTEETLPVELQIADDKKYTKLSIHIRLNDVHIQRIPVDNAVVEKINYINGVFVNPTLDKASTDNERNIVLLKTQNNDYICCVQIAGFISRRIACDLSVGEAVSLGKKYGIIKFGSRVDIYVPTEYKINAQINQTMIAGETVIAYI